MRTGVVLIAEKGGERRRLLPSTRSHHIGDVAMDGALDGGAVDSAVSSIQSDQAPKQACHNACTLAGWSPTRPGSTRVLSWPCSRTWCCSLRMAR